MIFLDSHTHIYLSDFDADRAAMLQRAADIGVERVLLPAIDSETHAKQLEIEAAFPELCRSMMGLHPCSAKENVEQELAIVRQYLETSSFVAIGEIGLDPYWDKSAIPGI